VNLTTNTGQPHLPRGREAVEGQVREHERHAEEAGVPLLRGDLGRHAPADDEQRAAGRDRRREPVFLLA